MKYRVFILKDAEQDIVALYRFIALNDSTSRADTLIDQLEDKYMSLAELAHCGHVPPELERISVFTYLEIHLKSYRIIYQISDKNVFIHCVLDGRRDLSDILHERLLR
ncbi:MAG: type II toxin-antitoxin system RelE/ParE family toxin [Calditrichaeota bacterium]|nr:type II toxin-antitoxin system RelE/ParE family toxin [Calditrichota bacterium]